MASILSIQNVYNKEQKRKNRWTIAFEDVPGLAGAGDKRIAVGSFDDADGNAQNFAIEVNAGANNVAVQEALVNAKDDDNLGEKADVETNLTYNLVDNGKNLQLALFSAQRPNYTIGETELHRINQKAYWPAGKAEFQPLEVVFYDLIGLGAETGFKSLGNVFQTWADAVFDMVEGTVAYKSSLKTTGRLAMLGPKGNVLEVWFLKNMWPKDINYGDLSYDSTDAATIAVTFRYDLAIPVFIRPEYTGANQGWAGQINPNPDGTTPENGLASHTWGIPGTDNFNIEDGDGNVDNNVTLESVTDPTQSLDQD